ncbi:MAG TPA: hypothetical protein VLN45_09190 [Ignavibacteriaceae bacterium]|nr:hypothetical protein [Ignavibacteriaceae bacterium]
MPIDSAQGDISTMDNPNAMEGVFFFQQIVVLPRHLAGGPNILAGTGTGMKKGSVSYTKGF